MLSWGRLLLSWGRRTTTTIRAGGSGLCGRAGPVPADQGEQPGCGRVGPAAETATPNGPAVGRVPQRQHPAPAVVRAWARTQGLPVAARGPLPRWVLDQYLAQGRRPAPARRPPSATSPAA